MPAMTKKYDITVKARATFIPEQSDEAEGRYVFAYTITITNTGEVPAQLISRHWEIVNSAGEVEEVKGLGVVGQQPFLKPGEAFQYSSGCRLRTPSGTMQGNYFFVAEDGERFEVQIPPFILDDGSHRVLH